MIDWPMTLKAHNRDNGTDYSSRAEMLQALCEKHKSATKIGTILYVSNGSVLKAMKEDNLEIPPKGHSRPGELERKLLSLGDVSNLTFGQISKKVGWSREYGYRLLRKHKVKFKRLI